MKFSFTCFDSIQHGGCQDMVQILTVFSYPRQVSPFKNYFAHSYHPLETIVLLGI